MALAFSILGIICVFAVPSCLTQTLRDELIKPDSWSHTEHHNIVYNYMWTISNYSLTLSSSTVSSTFKTFGKEWRIDLGQTDHYSRRLLNLRLMTPQNNENANVNVKLYVANVRGQLVLVHQENPKNFYTNSPTSGANYNPVKNDTISHEDQVIIYCQMSTVVQSVSVGESLSQRGIGSNIQEALSALYETRDFSDITLVAHGIEFAAHKSILASSSTIFAAMFKPGNKHIRNNKVTIANMTYECLSEVMRYVYTGSVRNLTTLTLELLEAGERFHLNGLKLLCADALLQDLTVETAARICVHGDTYNLQRVKDMAVEFIKRNLQKVKETEGWKFMVSTQPELVIECFV